jgi:hypothetical protein
MLEDARGHDYRQVLFFHVGGLLGVCQGSMAGKHSSNMTMYTYIIDIHTTYIHHTTYTCSVTPLTLYY